jgi:hypothetical protein
LETFHGTFQEANPGLRFLHRGFALVEAVLCLVLHRIWDTPSASGGHHANLDADWVAQQARQVTLELAESKATLRFLIRDRDSKFTKAIDTVFQSEGRHITHIPIQTPNANAFAERWVSTVREECLDQLLILYETHLRRVLRTYGDY